MHQARKRFTIEQSQATANLAASIQHAFAPAPRVAAQPRCSHTKLLVVGESRSGKTTLIKTLFAAYAQVSTASLSF